MARLHGPNGCPWDKEQTHESLIPYLQEESKEVEHAIRQQDDDNLCEELGDVLLQVVFHAQLAKESNKFDIQDVVDGLCKKLIRRHPHVFGKKKLNSPEEVLAQWKKIKKREGEKA